MLRCLGRAAPIGEHKRQLFCWGEGGGGGDERVIEMSKCEYDVGVAPVWLPLVGSICFWLAFWSQGWVFKMFWRAFCLKNMVPPIGVYFLARVLEPRMGVQDLWPAQPIA